MVLNANDYTKFKKAYDKALKENKETFFYKGVEVLVSFAKYVLEAYESYGIK